MGIHTNQQVGFEGDEGDDRVDPCSWMMQQGSRTEHLFSLSQKHLESHSFYICPTTSHGVTCKIVKTTIFFVVKKSRMPYLPSKTRCYNRLFEWNKSLEDAVAAWQGMELHPVRWWVWILATKTGEMLKPPLWGCKEICNNMRWSLYDSFCWMSTLDELDVPLGSCWCRWYHDSFIFTVWDDLPWLLLLIYQDLLGLGGSSNNKIEYATTHKTYRNWSRLKNNAEKKVLLHLNG